MINLSKGRLGDINSHLLGLIIVGKLLMAALSRADIPEDQRSDFYLYRRVSKCHHRFHRHHTFRSPQIQTQSYHRPSIHRPIGRKYQKAVFGNVGSMGAFSVGAEDGEFLAKQFEPVFDAGDLLNIDNYRAYLKLLIEGQSSRPFNIATLPFQKEMLISAKKRLCCRWPDTAD